MKTGLWCLLFSAFSLIPLAWAGSGSAEEAGYKAWIEFRGGGPGLEIVPFCLGPEDGRIKYRLVALKKGRSGTSSSTQSGSVELEAGQPRALCRVGLNLQAGDEYRLHLRIYKDGRMVAEEKKTFSDATLELKT
jgi:hypothetical protein